jgi:dolichol-phosphate mannosyltransferase
MALFAQIARFPVRFGLSRPTAGWALVLVVAGLVSFARCDLPLQEPQESRYGEIPREMLAAGDWVVPRLHGQPYFDKPPLLYWLVMVSYRCFGTTDAAARLVPCTALFLGVVVSYAWGQRTVGPCAALAGVLILCLSCRAVQLARLLNMDGLLTLTVVAAWAAGHTALRAGRLRWDWWLVAAGVTGLGVLAKGPVALVLVLGPLALWSWWDRSSVRLTPTNGAVFVAVSLGLAAPWFVAVEARAPGFLQSFFWTHHVQRYLTPFDHEEPWWFYLPEVALALFPATLLVPRLIGRLVADKGRSEVVLFLIAALFCLGFFSIAGCKRPMYVLPALPPMALGLGWGVVGGCVSGREQVPRAACPPVVRAFITTDTSLGSRGMPHPPARERFWFSLPSPSPCCSASSSSCSRCTPRSIRCAPSCAAARRYVAIGR